LLDQREFLGSFDGGFPLVPFLPFPPPLKFAANPGPTPSGAGLREWKSSRFFHCSVYEAWFAFGGPFSLLGSLPCWTHFSPPGPRPGAGNFDRWGRALAGPCEQPPFRANLVCSPLPVPTYKLFPAVFIILPFWGSGPVTSSPF